MNTDADNNSEPESVGWIQSILKCWSPWCKLYHNVQISSEFNSQSHSAPNELSERILHTYIGIECGISIVNHHGIDVDIMGKYSGFYVL